MPSPSRSQFNSDAEPTGVLKSYSNVPNSPASDRSDIIADPVQLERELAHEGLHRDSAASEHDDRLRGPTISYEEALERELEYKKRMKMILLQPPVGSGLLPKPSQGGRPAHQQPQGQQPLPQQSHDQKPLSFQELPSNSSVVGVKRKAVCGELAESTSRGNPDPSLPPEQLQHWQAACQLRLFRQPPVQQLQEPQPLLQQSQHKKPLPQQLTNKQPLAQGLKHRQPLPQHSQDRQPVQRRSQGQQPLKQQSHNKRPPNFEATPLWCYLCMVNCGNPRNLQSHCQGKKHKAKLDKVFGSKTSTISDGAGGTEQAASSRHEQKALASDEVAGVAQQAASSRHEQDAPTIWKIFDHLK